MNNEQLVHEYIDKRLKNNNFNFPRTLGNLEQLLVLLLNEDRETVLKILKNG